MSVNRMKRKFLIVGFAIVLAWTLCNITKVYTILTQILSVLSPFILGLCIAFIMNLTLRSLEQNWSRLSGKKKSSRLEKIKRPVCLLVSFLILFGAILIIFCVLVPELKKTFYVISDILPTAVKNTQSWWSELSLFFEQYGIILPSVQFDSNNVMDAVNRFFTHNGGYVFDRTMGITISIISILLDVVLALVFSVYLLAQKERVGQSAKKLLYVILKTNYADRVLHLLSLTETIFAKYIRAQIIEALIIGVLCFVGMSVIGLPYALVISVVISFTALIPIFGAWAGACIGTFLIVFAEPAKAVWFIVFIFLLQQIESNLIYPKIIGSSIGLPGLWVLVAVTIGGSTLGVLGMLFAVPTFSVIYTIVSEYVCLKSQRKN